MNSNSRNQGSSPTDVSGGRKYCSISGDDILCWLSFTVYRAGVNNTVSCILKRINPNNKLKLRKKRSPTDRHSSHSIPQCCYTKVKSICSTLKEFC